MRAQAIFLVLLLLFTFSAQLASAATGLNLVRPDCSVDIEIGNGDFQVSRDALREWVKAAADAVAKYYGTFPMRRVIVRVTAAPGRGIGFATASYERDSGLIEVPLGVKTTARDLDEDWTLTHEMVHLGFPLMARQQLWIAEGIATYVEPLARLRNHAASPEAVWGDLVRDLPNGLPTAGDRGLDHTHTWGRTYWGGTLYCLIADIEIHRRTGDRKGLEDALRAIAAHGGNIASDWSAREAFAVGDRATGVPVLQELYATMASAPLSVKLPVIWSLLGVCQRGGTVYFDESAPLARVRRSITYGKPVG